MQGPRGHRGVPGQARRNRHRGGEDSMASIRAKASLHALVQRASQFAARNVQPATEVETQNQHEHTEVDSGSGAGQLGQCFERDAECEKLGVADNLCGKCKDLGGGAFELHNPGGLRFMGRWVYLHVCVFVCVLIYDTCKYWPGVDCDLWCKVLFTTMYVFVRWRMCMNLHADMFLLYFAGPSMTTCILPEMWALAMCASWQSMVMQVCMCVCSCVCMYVC
jgi:hypothetical protein